MEARRRRAQDGMSNDTQVVDTADHWRGAYAAKDPAAVSWFQASPTPSLAMIRKTGLGEGAHILDAGGGASPLVDHLLAERFCVTVLDIAETGLEAARSRLGPRAEAASWVVADVTRWRPTAQFDLWHDRAVFHFLTEPDQRARYFEALRDGLTPSGWVIMATFAPDGPERCSGLTVRRWSVTDLVEAFGADFRLMDSAEETHLTPWGSPQLFTWTLFQRVPAP
jgi:trans-aconitate methyltransferase